MQASSPAQPFPGSLLTPARRARAALRRGAMALLGAFLAFGLAFAAHPGGASAAAPSGSMVYQVTISGTASGNPFTRTGYVVLSSTITRTTTNGVNPLDVWLTSGNPLTSPQLGAISFGTNNSYLGGSSLLDIAYVAYNGTTQTITIQPDPSYGGIGANVFNSSGGLLGSLYQIYGGQMQLQLRDGGSTIAGTVDVVAKGAYYYTQASYRATVTGRFVGTI